MKFFAIVIYTIYIFQGPTYTFDDRRTRDYACNNPLIPDPYEMNTLCIKKSKLHGSGEGAFVKIDVPAGRTIAFYNGVHKTELELVNYNFLPPMLRSKHAKIITYSIIIF